MRSRFTAFATGDADYLLASWDPSTRPARLELDGDVTWTFLDITDRVGGGPLDSAAIVAFVAHYRGADGAGRLVERCRFRRVNRRWYYLDGEIG